MQISKSAYQEKDYKLPALFSEFSDASTLDTGGKSLLDFYFSAAGLTPAKPLGPSGLLTTVTLRRCRRSMRSTGRRNPWPESTARLN